MLISSPIPNLIGGISQQPAALRLPTMCEDMWNAWPSVVSGNQKRPASQHIAKVPITLSNGAAGILIDRDETYRYAAVITNGDLRVIDLNTGALQTVSFPNGKTYLNATSPVDSFKAVTIGDFTFIANRNVTVTTSAVAEPVAGETRLNPANMATISVTQALANTYYSVYINNVLVAEYLTPTGVDASSAVPDTGVIAEQIMSDLTKAVGATGKLGTTQYTVTQTGSTLTITNFPAGGKIITQANTGDRSLRAFVDSVQTFSDLPPQSPEGRIVKVAGSPEGDGDDYFVVFKNNVWVETVAYNACVQPTASTMPHVLVRNADGTWTFRQHTWDRRIAGDATSNQSPSFVGFKINDLFTFSNRMGVLADENIILSGTDSYENFYRTSTAQVLDSDRIDIAVLSNQVQQLAHAVPYNRDLLISSETAQFRLTYQNFLSPKTAQVKFTTAFNMSARIRPVNMGNSIYFVDDRADYRYLKVWEYFPKDLAVSDDAEDVTAPIPELIPYGCTFLAGSNRVKAAVLSNAQQPSTLWFYKFYWAGERKVQSAWHPWTFNDCVKIHWGAFSGMYFYMLIERSDGLNLERIRFDEDAFDASTNYEVLIDRRAAPTSMTYNANTKKTTITLPWSTTYGTVEVVSNEPSNVENPVYGYRHEVTKVSNTSVTVDGDITTHTVSVGIPYIWYFEFSTVFWRQAQGEGNTAVMDGRVQLRYITVEYHNTAYFKTTVALPGRAPFETTFNGYQVGSVTSTLGNQAFSSGKHRIAVMSRNYDAKITLINDSPFPSAFGSAEWQGVIAPKSAKRL